MYVPLEKRNLFKCRTCHKLFRMDPEDDSALEATDIFLANPEAVAAVLAGVVINPLYCSDCVIAEKRPRI